MNSPAFDALVDEVAQLEATHAAAVTVEETAAGEVVKAQAALQVETRQRTNLAERLDLTRKALTSLMTRDAISLETVTTLIGERHKALQAPAQEG